MASNTEFEKSQYIVVNGKRMLLSEYRKMKKASTPKKKRASRIKATDVVGSGYKDISFIAIESDKLIKNAAPFKSLSVFYNHAYRSYGKVSEEIMKPYRREYTLYQSKYREVENLIKVMHDCAKNKENEVYDFAIKLSWKLDDMKESLNNLINKVRDNHEVTKRLFGGQPIYEGRKLGGKTERELGFKQQLFCQSPTKICKTMEKLEECVKTIESWGKVGRDPMEYKAF